MAKEKPKKTVPVPNKKPRGSLKEYFKGVKVEMKKVVWPTKKELISYTGVVILTCVVLGAAIWAVDSAFLAALKAVLNFNYI
ncbi:MAG: preprotein translocase subunit SecE [Anaerovoracaceae bacterium]|jgi:preprotein translocase subunit SecE